MKKVSLDTWIQLLGMLGLLGGLVFVGLDMQQTQTIALAAQANARSEILMSRNLAGFEGRSELMHLVQTASPEDLDEFEQWAKRQLKSRYTTCNRIITFNTNWDCYQRSSGSLLRAAFEIIGIIVRQGIFIQEN